MIYTPDSFLIPWSLWVKISSIIWAVSSKYSSFSSSSRNKVTNGDCPFVVIKVLIWYWIVCTPDASSSLILMATSWAICSSESWDQNCSWYFFWYFFLVTARYFPRCLIFTDCPPNCPLATEAIICVITVHATWKLFGVSINFPFITVPFSNISLIFTKQQLNIGWIK